MPEVQNLVLLLVGGLCALFLAVIGVRFFAALRTRRWAVAQATILTSEPRARRVGEPGPETVPHIVNEYTVGGQTHRSHPLKARAVPLGASDLSRFLSRYPAGATTPVYCDSASPREAVLEREPLSLPAERLGCLTAFATAVVLVAVDGLTRLHGLVSRWFPHADNEEVLVLASGLGVFLVLFGLMWLRQGMQERRWPVVPGTVVASGVESFKTLSAGGSGRVVRTTMYRAAVAYAHEVDADLTGVGHIWTTLVTPDGRGYAYTHGLFLEDHFLVEGLR